MPCSCGKRAPSSGGDNIRRKKPPCTCQQISNNIRLCCRGGKQPEKPKDAGCFCKPAPPTSVPIQKICKCDEAGPEIELFSEPIPKEKPKETKDEGTGPKKKPKPKKPQGPKCIKFLIKMSPEQLAAICCCGDECDCPICVCKPETLWQCKDLSEAVGCCIKLEEGGKCEKGGKGQPLKYMIGLSPFQLAATCDCGEEGCDCEFCTCKLKLKSCKILCLRRLKGRKTCKCVCMKMLDTVCGSGGGGSAKGEEEEEEEESEEEDDDFLGKPSSGVPQVSCKCKYIKAAVQKMQEKRKPCGPVDPPKCCPPPPPRCC